MDIFIIFILSVLTPFTLDRSNIEYTPQVGFLYTDTSNRNFGLGASSYKTKVIKTGRDLVVLDTTPIYDRATSSVNYEMFGDIKFPIGLKNKLWGAVRFSYAPNRENLKIRLMREDGRGRPSTRSLFINEEPAIGMILGYNIIEYHPRSVYKISDLGVSAYSGVSVFRMSYATASIFESDKSSSSAFKFYAGGSIQLDYNSKIDFQYTYITTEIRGLPDLSQNLELNIARLNVGFTYIFSDKELIRKANKDKVYKDIFDLI